ncbi:MAG: phosphoglycerate mutase family protein [Desulfuromonadaceae bacterium]|nr:phosphoglycerate mutase family protein [Desulfuromonadaceae bacterium]MDD5104504.1 phosphoglycerate mutase family protein [Desulfuromonadaceae bacterium]
MFLYVMRHAEAVEGSDSLQDEWRFLTESGRATAKKASTSFAKFGPKPRLTITSPLTRAVQTAEIAAKKACRNNVVVSSSLLLPGADNNELIAHLKECRSSKRILLVGHEPQLGLLIAALLDRPDAEIQLEKGAIVALKMDPDTAGKSASFLWYLVPGKKRTTSFRKAFPQQDVSEA